MDNIVVLTGMPPDEQSRLLELLVQHRGYNPGSDFSINQESFLQLERSTNTLNIWGFDPTIYPDSCEIKHYTEFM